MADIHRLPVSFKGDLPVEVILALAKERGLEEVIIIGRTKEGTIYVDHSTDSRYRINWLLDRVKFDMFNDG